MKLEEKAKVVERVKEELSGVKGIWVTDFTGLSVEGMMKLRRELRDKSLSYRVIKKAIFERVLKGLKIEGDEGWFDGSVGVCAGDDIVMGSRVLTEFQKDYPIFKIKGSWYEGDFFSPVRIKEIASLPGREVLIGRVLSNLRGSIFGIVWVLQEILRRGVRVLEEIKRVKSEG